MKNQTLFSSNDKSKKRNKMSSAAIFVCIFIGALRLRLMPLQREGTFILFPSVSIA